MLFDNPILSYFIELQVFNDKPSNTTIPTKRTNAEVGKKKKKKKGLTTFHLTHLSNTVSESKKKYASVERTARRREKGDLISMHVDSHDL